ncbi:hypothetical protein [Verrucomicrobium spinosum]|uniref:hypothetical protein n=1 Tax=Verrucomicrobium spinosum TaxID=2736 RepID=UPI000A7ABC73|nr:hypothetical protein [Verrucomicrobium spinosum]
MVLVPVAETDAHLTSHAVAQVAIVGMTVVVAASAEIVIAGAGSMVKMTVVDVPALTKPRVLCPA